KPTFTKETKDNFWAVLAVAICIVSVSLALILYCACRQLLRQGKRWDVAKPLGRGQIQPPAPRKVQTFSCALVPQDTPSQPPATYSLVNKVRNKTLSIPSYIEPLDDYDDVEIPANMEKRHF
uniref:SLP adaptor and CSK interacting membrane protein n=1 Tax=Panthera tigris altaica TaxID=74533 RepID=A0A8C9JRB8_PANTA